MGISLLVLVEHMYILKVILYLSIMILLMRVSSYDYMGLVRYIDDKPTARTLLDLHIPIMFGHMDKPDNGLTTSWTPSYGESGNIYLC